MGDTEVLDRVVAGATSVGLDAQPESGVAPDGTTSTD